MYRSTFSFPGNTGKTPIANYVGLDGTIGARVAIESQFEILGWYGATLSIEEGFQGYIKFYDRDSEEMMALFAVNPQEIEYADVATSSVKVSGTGSVRYDVTAEDTVGGPLYNVACWITTDELGRELIAGILYTNHAGLAVFTLDPGSYYLWRRLPGYNFPNPTSITVA